MLPETKDLSGDDILSAKALFFPKPGFRPSPPIRLPSVPGFTEPSKFSFAILAPAADKPAGDGLIMGFLP